MEMIETYLDFLATLVFFLIPTLSGSAVSYYTRKHFSKKKSDKIIPEGKHVTLYIMLCGLVPAIFMASSITAIRKYISLNMSIGLAFLLGCVGDDMLRVVSSLRNLMIVLKSFTKNYIGSDKTQEGCIDSVIQTIDDAQAQISKTEEDNKVNGGTRYRDGPPNNNNT